MTRAGSLAPLLLTATHATLTASEGTPMDDQSKKALQIPRQPDKPDLSELSESDLDQVTGGMAISGISTVLQREPKKIDC